MKVRLAGNGELDLVLYLQPYLVASTTSHSTLTCYGLSKTTSNNFDCFIIVFFLFFIQLHCTFVIPQSLI